MRWWNDIWLNESFATFLEPKMTTMLYPDWNIIADFVKRETAGAMHSDSLLSTHPIDVVVNSPDEIAQIFDAISYGKGASVIRMMEAFVGEDSFQRGVSNYLKEIQLRKRRGKRPLEALGKSIEATRERHDGILGQKAGLSGRHGSKERRQTRSETGQVSARGKGIAR